MKIGLEMRHVILGSCGGVAQLLRGVLRCLVERHPEHEYVFFSTVFNGGLLQPLPDAVDVVVLPLHGYCEQLGKLAQEKQVDVLFRGYPMSEAVDFPSERQIFQIPDIQHEYYPEFFTPDVLKARRESFNKVLDEAGAIGTISGFARQTLLAQKCNRCRDIFLMSPALQIEHQQTVGEPLTAAEEALVPEGEFFLFPANLWPHKNHRRVLQAFAKFRETNGRPVEFIFTGHPAGWENLAAEFSGLPVRHLGFVRAPVLRRLLEKAQALVFFSLYEGFGMPLLEAFDAGTPVICSNSTSLPEVGGNAILSCDPLDVDAMSQCMADILRDRGMRQMLVQNGKERLKAYTWEQAADNLLAACRRVHGDHIALDASQPLRIKVHEWPVVSIVTPSYNQGRFLKRTIDSVLAQDYPHVQYVVMDGGSKDESIDILKSYGDRFPWVSEPDRGQTHAINKGFARTRGDFQAYLNSDDTLLPGAVATVVDHFLRRPACDLVYGDAHYIDENDNITGRYNTATYSFARLMQDCCICQPAAFWRTRIAQKVGPFNEQLHYAMDYDYWMRVDRAGGRLEYLPRYLANSRIYPETKTRSCRTKIYDEIIQISMKNAGFASLSYFQGLWHHLCYERGTGWPFYFRSVPRLGEFMASMHHYWYNRQSPIHHQVLRHLGRHLKQQAKRPFRVCVRLARPLARLLHLRRPGAARGAVAVRAVSGFWNDNWLAPTLTVRLGDSTVEQRLHLVGSSPQATELTVRLRGQAVNVVQLQPEQTEKITFEVAPGKDRNLELEFSQFHTDHTGRKLAFLLQETNIFGESDLAA